MMDRKRIFIANLSKGKLGEDKSNLLGALLVSEFHLAAMGGRMCPRVSDRFPALRGRIPVLATDSFASILSEARSTASRSPFRTSTPTNCPKKSKVRCLEMWVHWCPSASDNRMRRFWSESLGRSLRLHSLLSFRNHHVLVRILNGGAAEPFRGRHWNLWGKRWGKETIIRRNRERYASKREEVDGRSGGGWGVSAPIYRLLRKRDLQVRLVCELPSLSAFSDPNPSPPQ